MKFSVYVIAFLASIRSTKAMAWNGKRRIAIEPEPIEEVADQTTLPAGAKPEPANKDMPKEEQTGKAGGTSNPSRKKPSIEKKIVKNPIASPQYVKRKPNDVWVEGIEGGVVSVRISKPGNPANAAYAYEFYQELRRKDRSDIVERYKSIGDFKGAFFGVIPLRSEDGQNLMMSQAPGSAYNFDQLIFFMEKDEDNTGRNRQVIAEMVIDDINRIAEQQFRYQSRFEFAGDLTDPDTEDLPPAAQKMLDEDVMKLMDTMYPPSAYTREQQSVELAWLFFGDREDAPTLIQGYPIREPAQQVLAE